MLEGKSRRRRRQKRRSKCIGFCEFSILYGPAQKTQKPKFKGRNLFILGEVCKSPLNFVFLGEKERKRTKKKKLKKKTKSNAEEIERERKGGGDRSERKRRERERGASLSVSPLAELGIHRMRWE